MGNFEVMFDTVTAIRDADNLDRLEYVDLHRNPSVLVPKGQYNLWQPVIYFPVDSIIPMELVKRMGMEGKLSRGDANENDGGKRLLNRVKTVSIRGNISQGLVFDRLKFLEWGYLDSWSFYEVRDLTGLLGVKKFEVPSTTVGDSKLAPMPPLVETYKIQSAHKYPDILARLMDEQTIVSVTEKLEGTNWWCHIDANGEFSVGSRRHRIIPSEKGHEKYWQAFTGQFKKALVEISKSRFNSPVTIRGELIGSGIQDNIYGFNKKMVRVFDIEINGKPVDYGLFRYLCSVNDLTVVPVIEHKVNIYTWLHRNSIEERANGRSMLYNGLREGIVVKPWVEQVDPEIGRVFLKQRSAEYLARNDL